MPAYTFTPRTYSERTRYELENERASAQHQVNMNAALLVIARHTRGSGAINETYARQQHARFASIVAAIDAELKNRKD